MTYQVRITAVAYVTTTVEVDAPTGEQAEKQAREEVQKEPEEQDWKFDGLHDQNISVNDVVPVSK